MTAASPLDPPRGASVAPAVGFLAAAALLALFPAFVRSPYALHVMVLLFLAVTQGEAWNVLGGYAGRYSVGHAAYFGVGAYLTLMLLRFRQVPPWWGAWAAAAAAVVLGLALGSITFRLRGPYFVVASLAVAEIARLLVLGWKQVTNGAEGILVWEVPPLRIGGAAITDFAGKVPYYYMGLCLAAVAVAVTWAVQRSRLGRCFRATGEDRARSPAIPSARCEYAALAISAFLTAWSGALYGIYAGFVEPGLLAADVSVQIVLICMIGGIGTTLGPVLGALVLVPLSEALRTHLLAHALFGLGLSPTSRIGLFLEKNPAQARVLVYAILMAAILWMPDGVLGLAKGVARRRAAARDTAVAGGAA